MLHSATVLIISLREFNTIITQHKLRVRRDIVDKPKALTILYLEYLKMNRKQFKSRILHAFYFRIS